MYANNTVKNDNTCALKLHVKTGATNMTLLHTWRRSYYCHTHQKNHLSTATAMHSHCCWPAGSCATWEVD